ncbi:ROK family transcriptional regulator [Streptomyces sp. NBC_00094]|uniref:ROK family transcriptional regulator n=1 Tax=Streptomyces sp. NBC_00094 TaxID=2903620 RepID=UPI00224EE047|nr:ROK family transcriptional regulator [Streptomyces sp. NBC_00094]MCX5389095.1 ROK family transcriptional regulator [Streptomyces sp. NBC_00094]
MTDLIRGTPGLVRAINNRTTLHLLLKQGPLTRPEISKITGLSKPTASQVLARLEEAGLVVSHGVRKGQPGRVPETYGINPSAAFVAAIDVTPEWIAVRVADIAGTVVGEAEVPAPETSTRSSVLKGLRAALSQVRVAQVPRHVVIGVQGAVDPTTGRLEYASEADMAGWLLPDVDRVLSEELGVPVRVENDVNLAAVAEQTHAAADCPDFVLLWADEGIGAALVIGGRLHRGFFGGAGEVGYLPLPGAATARDAGRFGRHGYQELAGGETVLDLLRTYGVRGADFPDAVVEAVRLATETSGSQAEEARAGLRVVAARLAVGLASIVTVVDPGLVVLAGRLSAAGGEYLRELVERELRVFAHSRARIRLSAVGDNPVLSGALDLALAAARKEVFGEAVPGAGEV